MACAKELSTMSDSLEKQARVNLLMDCYEELLTDKQRNYLRLYYQDDLSLSEIALELDVSRNAVYDNLKKAVALLEKYEEKLHLLEKHMQRLSLLEKLDASLAKENPEIEEYLKMLRKV